MLAVAHRNSTCRSRCRCSRSSWRSAAAIFTATRSSKTFAHGTDGEVTLTASTLYAAIKRLLESGLVSELDERLSADDARRRY